MTTQRLLRMPQTFDLAAFLRLHGRLQQMVSRGCDRLVLDFSATEKAYPDGMVPLIATLMRLHETRAFVTEFFPPRKLHLKGVFGAVGWDRYLVADKQEFEELPRRTPQFTPLRPFGREELGRLHRSIVDVLTSQAVLSETVPDAIDWALWEVMDNVLNHAGVRMGWVQASTFREKKHINIVVADSGRGIRGSFAERDPSVDDREALRRAIETGETRDPSKFRGYGLFGCRDIAIQSGGQLRLLSGEWQFVQEAGRKTTNATTAEALRRYYPARPRFHGTLVELMVRTDRRVDMARALGRDRIPAESFVQLTRGDRDGIVFRISEEAIDVGTRDAGRKLRNRVLNLTTGATDKTILDFSGVTMVSSSFADEFVAKLAKRMGRRNFDERFELRGLNPTVNTVVQIALWERVERA